MNAPVVDDAAITIGYGLSLWSGHGLRLTENSQATEGFSSPVWVLITGLCSPLHIDPLRWAWWLDALFGACGVGLFWRWGASSERRSVHIEDSLVWGVTLSVLSFCFWLSSGMETGVEVFLLGLSGLLAFRESHRKKGASTGIALGLLSLSRPEGIAFAGCVGLWWLLVHIKTRPFPWRQTFAIAGRCAAIVGAYVAFRWFYFGELLPNTYFAKRTWDFHWRDYAMGFWGQYDALLMACGAASVLGLLHRSSRSRTFLALMFCLLQCLFVVISKGDWMREWRFIVPIVPALGVVLAAPISGARQAWKNRTRVWQRALISLSLLCSVLLVAAAATTAVLQAKRLQPLKDSPEFSAEFVMHNASEWKKTLDANGAKRPLVGLPDVGGLSLVFRQAEILDVAGLADYALAHARNLDAMEDYIVHEGLPAIIDAHGPSGHIARPKIRESYGGWGGGVGWLPALSENNDSRCPGSKGQVLSWSTLELQLRIEHELKSAQPLTALALWRCAFSYVEDDQLPPERWRRSIASVAAKRGEELRQADLAQAVQFLSFATVVAGGNGPLRRKTEQLRAKLFPAVER